MGLLSFLQRRPAAGRGESGPAEAGDEVAQARTRARRRLIGASVLVVIGVIGFPLVFETQPRPVPVDIPIEIPRKQAAAPLPMPPARKPSAPVAVAKSEPITETAADAGREVAPPASVPAAPVRAASAPEPARKPAPVTVASAPAAESQRAKALLEGRATAKVDAPAVKDTAAKEPAREAAKEPSKEPAKDAGRFVVQVGAFADQTAAREMRGKVEKLGLKTYTQVVETSSGSRIRVRAGPFASRDEADKARERAQAAGMTGAVVLTL